MITPIVRSVQALLRKADEGHGPPRAVDIVFPVAADAVAADDVLGIVPGVLGGEGCSTAGGCATCPYMKMNTLEGAMAVLRLLAPVGAAVGSASPDALVEFAPRSYRETIAGRSAASLGSEPILAMRAFGKTGLLPPELVARVMH